jgi:hypothetical protein
VSFSISADYRRGRKISSPSRPVARVKKLAAIDVTFSVQNITASIYRLKNIQFYLLVNFVQKKKKKL